MTPSNAAEIVKDITFGNWTIEVKQPTATEFWLRVSFLAEDSDKPDGKLHRQYGRKWRLSVFMTRSEVVQTAFKAILTALEHEAREEFKYRGVAVFGPHIDVDALAEAAQRKEVRS